MQLGRIVSATVLAVVLGSGLADARGLEISGPMEVPPATYTGRQYVDSAGCVFVRAGYGGAVNWVARVGRDRKQLCGYKPTFGPSAPVLEVAKSAPAPAPAPVPVTAAAPRPTAVVTAPQVLVKPAPVVARPGTAIAKTQTVGRPMQTIATTTSMPTIGLAANRRLAPVVAAPAGQAPVVVADTSGSPSAYVSAYQRRNQDAPTPVAGLVIVSAQTVSGGQTACPNLSPVAQRYMLNDGRHVVRCGPQIEDPVGYINRAKVPGLQVVAVTPQVYAATYGTAPVAVQAAPAVPKGYKAAWNDGRLNPRRGVGTAAGKAQMARLWTDEVPARLVADQTPTQRLAGTPTAARVSTKSQPKAPVAASVAGRFVQVGTFSEPANAEAAKARLRAAGLPVATSRFAKGGQKLQIVLAGPFGSQRALRAALGTARQAGFTDAFTR